MEFRVIKPEELETVFALGGASQDTFAEYAENYKKSPELFTACFENNQMIGACYGWPILHERDKIEEIFLSAIAVKPEYQHRGIGSKLFEYWQGQLKRTGNRIIDIGSIADKFYLSNGCIPVEYCLKIHKDNFKAQNYGKHTISFIRYAEDPLVVIYIKTGGVYKPEIMDELKKQFKAEEGLYIFKKEV